MVIPESLLELIFATVCSANVRNLYLHKHQPSLVQNMNAYEQNVEQELGKEVIDTCLSYCDEGKTRSSDVQEIAQQLD